MLKIWYIIQIQTRTCPYYHGINTLDPFTNKCDWYLNKEPQPGFEHVSQRSGASDFRVGTRDHTATEMASLSIEYTYLI